MHAYRSFLTISALLYLTACSGASSYVHSNDSHPAPPSKTVETHQRDAVINTLHQTLGSPYLLGGTTLRGFDCSGLTSYVYRSAGISIPRTAAKQRKKSRNISSYAQLRLGDLIFFKIRKKTDHVGIYVGDGMFVHASTSKKRVSYAKLDTPYWRRAFVKFGSYIETK